MATSDASLTDANIFYDGFAVSAKDPGPKKKYYEPNPTALMDLNLYGFVPPPAGDVDALYNAPLRSQKQLIALTMVLGRRIDTIIKNNETSTEAALASLSTLARALGVISQQNLTATDRIVKSLQEIKGVMSKGSSSSGSGASLVQIAQPASPESVRSTMISRLLQHIASHDVSHKETATLGKLYADMAREGSFDVAGGVTFTQLVGMAKDKGLVLEETSSDGGRYLKLSL